MKRYIITKANKLSGAFAVLFWLEPLHSALPFLHGLDIFKVPALLAFFASLGCSCRECWKARAKKK